MLGISTNPSLSSPQISFGGTDTYTGTHFEVGLCSDSHEWYLGYQLLHSDLWTLHDYYYQERIPDSTYTTVTQDGQGWSNEFRCTLGYRFHPGVLDAQRSLSPMIGAAMSVGRSEHHSTYDSQTDRLTKEGTYYRRTRLDSTHSHRRDSPPAFASALVEFGTSLKLSKKLSIGTQAQFHVLVAFFDKDFRPEVGDLMPAWILGLRYTHF